MLKYELIEKDIQRKIENGTYKPNDRLPMEKEMCETYGVSKITVKRAMDSLVAKGLILKRRGAGSFVQDINIDDLSNAFNSMSSQVAGFTEDYRKTGKKITSIVHIFEVIVPPENVAKQLRIEPESFTYHILRTRLLDGVPAATEDMYMPIDIIPGLKMEHLESSIYRYIREDLGHRVYSAHRTLRAKMPTEEYKKYLQLADNVPLFEVEQVGFLDDGRRFEYSISEHPGDKYEFFTVSFN
ncbi:MAG: GntR family transcriptional regulator [Eubacteriaceae bacterium]|jgi:GntR family transcriptional regulator